MRIAIDTQSILGRRTGIGQGAIMLLVALRKIAPQHKFIDINWEQDVTMRLHRRLYWQQWKLPCSTRKHHADLLHIPGFDAPLWHPCPTILTVHDLIGMLFPANLPPVSRFYWARWLPFSVRFADHILADSANTKNDIVRLLGIAETKITVVSLGVSTSFHQLEHPEPLQAIRHQFKLWDDFVLFVSTLEPRKGLDTLLQAFARLQPEHPELKLVLVGKPGWYTDRLFAQQDLEPLCEKVIFTGYVSDEELVALYNAAALLAFPSRYEGFGLTVLEAMACGTPVVCSNSSSLPEIAGDAALLVPPNQPEHLASMINQVLVDPTLRETMRAKGLKQAARFTWEKTAEKTLAVYDMVYRNLQAKS